jgi:hypothetical protein
MVRSIAYPFVRGAPSAGQEISANPRALNVEANVEVHVNEQSIVSLGQYLKRAGFTQVKVWLNSPPQHRIENIFFRGARHVFFKWVPFRWFFEREVFAVGTPIDREVPAVKWMDHCHCSRFSPIALCLIAGRLTNSP